MTTNLLDVALGPEEQLAEAMHSPWFIALIVIIILIIAATVVTLVVILKKRKKAAVQAPVEASSVEGAGSPDTSGDDTDA